MKSKTKHIKAKQNSVRYTAWLRLLNVYESITYTSITQTIFPEMPPIYQWRNNIYFHKVRKPIIFLTQFVHTLRQQTNQFILWPNSDTDAFIGRHDSVLS